jgi:hypothetical protein
VIIEGIVTTINADGSTNISPMGPLVENSMDRLVLRPYNTSTTYANLKRTGQGVFHVTDDVLLLAQSAVGAITPEPKMLDAEAIAGRILADACRWYALQIVEIDDSAERVTMVADVVDRGTIREFFGFNRAKHAVLEAAILATRIEHLPHAEILTELGRLASPVQKTAGPQETAAFDFLQNYIHAAIEADTA